MRPALRCLIVLISGLMCILLVGCDTPGTIGGANHLPSRYPAAPTQAPLPPISFPQDEAPHHDLTEWWYYTGHLHGLDASHRTHAYGFELTIFQTLRGQFPPYYAAHFAISDLGRGTFHYDQRVALGSLAALPPSGSTHGFDITVGGWQMQGLAGHDELSAAMADYGFALHLVALKPAVLHGGNGIITYGTAGFSYYYSRPLIAVSGTLTDHTQPISISGTAWMDHQWGNFVSLAGSGWDWYSLQLSNSTEFMLYVIRDNQQHPLSTVGTYIAANGTAEELSPTSYSIQSTATWTSPVTRGVYPSGWRLTLDTGHIGLTLTPELLDQELVTAQSTGVAYWEGAVSIRGSIGGTALTGQGYVELTGYASVPPDSQQLPIP